MLGGKLTCLHSCQADLLLYAVLRYQTLEAVVVVSSNMSCHSFV